MMKIWKLLMRLLNNNLTVLTEKQWLKDKFKSYYKKWSFWFWGALSLYFFFNTWKHFSLCILTLYVYTLVLFIFNRLTVTIRNKSKFSIAKACMQLNFLKSLEKSSLNKNNLITFALFYLFRLVVGFTYKILKLSISFYDCFYCEYCWSGIWKKKKIIILCLNFSKNLLKSLYLKNL